MDARGRIAVIKAARENADKNNEELANAKRTTQEAKQAAEEAEKAAAEAKKVTGADLRAWVGKFQVELGKFEKFVMMLKDCPDAVRTAVHNAVKDAHETFEGGYVRIGPVVGGKLSGGVIARLAGDVASSQDQSERLELVLNKVSNIFNTLEGIIEQGLKQGGNERLEWAGRQLQGMKEIVKIHDIPNELAGKLMGTDKSIDTMMNIVARASSAATAAENAAEAVKEAKATLKEKRAPLKEERVADDAAIEAAQSELNKAARIGIRTKVDAALQKLEVALQNAENHAGVELNPARAARKQDQVIQNPARMEDPDRRPAPSVAEVTPHEEAKKQTPKLGRS